VDGRALGRHCLLNGSQVFGTPTSVLYRTEAVRALQPFFDESSLSNDTDVCYRILRSWDFGFDHRILSFCRTENESITAGIVSFNPYILHALIMLEQHGPYFLAPAELEARREAARSEYFSFLGEAVLAGRSPEFWAYHARGLAMLGQSLDRRRQLRWGAAALVELVGNPKRTLERLARRRGRGLDAAPPSLTTPVSTS
jgi:hypothetical protein